MAPAAKTTLLIALTVIAGSQFGYAQSGSTGFTAPSPTGFTQSGYSPGPSYPPALGRNAYPPALYSQGSFPQSSYPQSSYPQNSAPQSSPVAEFRSWDFAGHSDSSVEQLYLENSKKPLGGLFAKGFTRTMTLLGGWNFARPQQSDDAAINPLIGVPAFGLDSLDLDTGYAISFAFGRRHSHKLRSEIELAVRENDISVDAASPLSPTFDLSGLGAADFADNDNNVRTWSVMKNFIHDFHNDSRFTPYVGAGLGWSYIDVEAPALGVDGGTGAFSYQAIGGVATSLNKATDFIVEYRFLGTSEVEFEELGQEVSYDTHNLFLGLKLEY